MMMRNAGLKPTNKMQYRRRGCAGILLDEALKCHLHLHNIADSAARRNDPYPSAARKPSLVECSASNSKAPKRIEITHVQVVSRDTAQMFDDLSPSKKAFNWQSSLDQARQPVFYPCVTMRCLHIPRHLPAIEERGRKACCFRRRLVQPQHRYVAFSAFIFGACTPNCLVCHLRSVLPRIARGLFEVRIHSVTFHCLLSSCSYFNKLTVLDIMINTKIGRY